MDGELGGDSSPRGAEDWFQTVACHYVEAQIAFHLGRVGVLEVLERRGAATADEIASELGLRVGILTPLLDYLAAVSPLLQSDGDRFVLTPFGRVVLDRYGIRDGDRRIFNLFDVRVGAYQPVWGALGPLLRGEVEYGREIHRTGDYAADALYKLARGLVSGVDDVLTRLRPATLIELGPTSGLVQRIASKHPDLICSGIDRKQSSLSMAAIHAERAGLDPPRVSWIHSDIHDFTTWSAKVPCGPDAVVLSCHFHEFLSEGMEKMRVLIRAMRSRMPGAHVIAIEQPRLREPEPGKLSTTEWLQGHANVLIHHLVENARCLFEDEWLALFEEQGCRHVATEDPRWAGEKIFVFQL